MGLTLPSGPHDSEHLRSLYQEVAQSLLESTGASRTTVRLCRQDGSVELVAECLAPGVASMHGGPVTNISAAPTYQYLLSQRDLLIQNDCRTGEPSPPRSLVDFYHVYAQMLAPVVIDDAMVATISVHQVGSAREWTADEIESLAAARARLEAAMAERA